MNNFHLTRAGPTYNIKDYDLFVEDNLAIYILKSIRILHFLLSNAIKNIMKSIWRIMFF